MATITNFTIIKGKALEFSIIVKENGTTTPLKLSPTDVFTFSLVDKKTNIKYIEDKLMLIHDALNGKVNGIISAKESNTLPTKRGSAEDGYIPRANLKLVVNGNTGTQGEMTASIEDVYVIVG